MPPSPKLNQKTKTEKPLNIQDQYIKNIRYGITSIDTNLPLKKFITKQNEKKNLAIDQTQKDIALFMENFCNTKREVHGDEEPKIGRRAKTSRPGKRGRKNALLTGDDS